MLVKYPLDVLYHIHALHPASQTNNAFRLFSFLAEYKGRGTAEATAQDLLGHENGEEDGFGKRRMKMYVTVKRNSKVHITAILLHIEDFIVFDRSFSCKRK